MNELFDTPNVDPINRDNERKIYKPHFSGGFQKKTQPPTTDPNTPEEPIIEIDPFWTWVMEKLNITIAQAEVVKNEAIALLDKIVEDFNRSLVDVPDYIIELINALVDDDVIYVNKETPEEGESNEISLDSIKCLLTMAEYYGKLPGNTIDDKLDELKEHEDNTKLFTSLVKDLTPKITGWWMFMFMVRFIVAFAVHMTVGFTCCYLKGKLKLSVTIAGNESVIAPLGDYMSTIFGRIEDWMKEILGFPCANKKKNKADCPVVKSKNKEILDADWSIFPCCPTSCGKDTNGNKVKDAFKNIKFKECFQRAISNINDYNNGDEPADKPCGINGTQQWSNINGQNADTLAKWFVTHSDATNENNTNTYNTNGTSPTDAQYSKNAINGADESNTITKELKSSFNDSWTYNATYKKNSKGMPCKLESLDGTGPLRKFEDKNYDDITQKDIKDLAKDYINVDFSKELKEANGEIKDLKFDPKHPPEAEPFKSIYAVIQTTTSSLSGLLNSLRTGLTQAKMFSGVLSSKDFCCVIYSIVVLGNLIRFQDLCPDKDLSELFDYSEEFANSKDVSKIKEFISFLSNLIDVLIAENKTELSLTGVGLPLGTMIDLLKKAVGNSAVMLLAMAMAPVLKTITKFEAEPTLKNLMNDNCYGIGDLFAMIKCGINWTFNMVKKWAEELIPFQFRNETLLKNITIGSFQLKFLAEFKGMLDMLLSIITKLGTDCYPPENVIKEIANELPPENIGKPQTTMKVIEVQDIPDYKNGVKEVFYKIDDWENIGNPVESNDGSVIFPSKKEEIIEMIMQSTIDPDTNDLNTFPIMSEAIKIGFLKSIEKRNGLNLDSVELAYVNNDIIEKDIKETNAIYTDVGLKETLNMVKELKDLSNRK